jgi:hypothetical protein
VAISLTTLTSGAEESQITNTLVIQDPASLYRRPITCGQVRSHPRRSTGMNTVLGKLIQHPVYGLPRKHVLGTSVNRGKKEGGGYEGPPPTAKRGSATSGALPMSNLRSALLSPGGVLCAHNASYTAVLFCRYISFHSVFCNDAD